MERLTDDLLNLRSALWFIHARRWWSMSWVPFSFFFTKRSDRARYEPCFLIKPHFHRSGFMEGIIANSEFALVLNGSKINPKEQKSKVQEVKYRNNGRRTYHFGKNVSLVNKHSSNIPLYLHRCLMFFDIPAGRHYNFIPCLSSCWSVSRLVDWFVGRSIGLP